jgi:hypothetical protein
VSRESVNPAFFKFKFVNVLLGLVISCVVLVLLKAIHTFV